MGSPRPDGLSNKSLGYVFNEDTWEWEPENQSVIKTDTLTVNATFPDSLAVTGPLTDAELRNSDIKVSLDGESVSVTGSFYPATQPVSATALPLPSGAANSANQDTLETLTETLQELSQRLAVIGSWASSGAPGMRIVGVGGTIAATGPLTNAQYVATPVIGAIHYTQRTGIENTTAVLSNISNCTGA